jgi:putative N6-adenine-specific DNA methylase
VGLRTRRRIQFFNSQIECRLLKYEIYAGTKRKFADRLPPAEQSTPDK